VSALYFLSEKAEEHAYLTRRVISYTIYVLLAAHVLLLIFDGFEGTPILVGIAAHVSYFFLVKRFPVVSLKETRFIVAAGHLLPSTPLSHFLSVMMLLDNIVWYRFYFFNHIYEVHWLRAFSFFFGFIWLVPVLFLLSLSINDYALPLGGAIGGLPASTLRKVRTPFLSSLCGIAQAWTCTGACLSARNPTTH